MNYTTFLQFATHLLDAFNIICEILAMNHMVHSCQHNGFDITHPKRHFKEITVTDIEIRIAKNVQNYITEHSRICKLKSSFYVSLHYKSCKGHQ